MRESVHIDKICAKLREAGHDDEAQAIALVDLLMHEYGLADDLLTFDAIELRDELMGIAAKWAGLPAKRSLKEPAHV